MKQAVSDWLDAAMAAAGVSLTMVQRDAAIVELSKMYRFATREGFDSALSRLLECRSMDDSAEDAVLDAAVKSAERQAPAV